MRVSTEEQSVPGVMDADEAPPPPAPPAPVARRRTWPWWAGFATLVLVAAALVGAFTVEIGYFEFRPGTARPTSSLVRVPDGVAAYPPGGEIAFTTVTLRQSTVASYVLAWFDDDVEVVEDDLILGGRTPQENRQFNLQLMDTSKQEAIRVALQHLGHEVPVTLDGVVIVAIEEGSAADGRLEAGQTVVAIDGEPIDDVDDITRIMGTKAPGDLVRLEIEPPSRDEARTVEIELGAAPDDPERGFIGVSLEPRNPQYQFPFDIDIDSGEVGGPSAGLAFSLAVLDHLTPGELTGGLRVAATGTIDARGAVGPVGGVRQKTAAVSDDGYDVFLVPSSEYRVAAQRAGDTLRVIPVDTLGEALDALASLGGSGLGTQPGES